MASTSLPPLPPEALVHIFEFLRVDDIKSCRLVCSKWRSCCEENSITRKEMYVFRADVYAPYEINQILRNHRRAEIHLEFKNGVRLQELDYVGFGSKIRSLRIKNCYIGPELLSSIVTMFLYSPNMKSITLDNRKPTLTAQVLREIIIRLHLILEHKGSALKLETMQCPNLDASGTNEFDLPYQKLYEIFPALKSIYFPYINLSDMACENEPLKNDLTELFETEIYVDPNHCSSRMMNFFESMPRLKKLDISMQILSQGENNESFQWCLRFFTMQKWLDTLILSFNCRSMCTEGSTDDEVAAEPDEKVLPDAEAPLEPEDDGDELSNEDTTTTCPAITIFFRALKDCGPRLEMLCFFLDCTPTLHLDKTAMREFVQAIPNVRHLSIPIITLVDSDASFATYLASVDKLERLHLKRTDEVYCAESEPALSSELCADLSTILDSLKNLRKLKVTIETEIDPVDPTSPPSGEDVNIGIRHVHNNKLEALKLFFRNWTMAFVQSLISWDFPNLLVLYLMFGHARSRAFFESDSEIVMKNMVIEWVGKMAYLKNVFVRWFYMDIEESIELCERLPRLRIFGYESITLPSEEKMLELFARCPKLNAITVWVRRGEDPPRPYYFYVCRSKRLLYYSEDASKSLKPMTPLGRIIEMSIEPFLRTPRYGNQ